MGLMDALVQSFEDEVTLLKAGKDKLQAEFETAEKDKLQAEFETGSQLETVPDEASLEATKSILEGKRDRKDTTVAAVPDNLPDAEVGLNAPAGKASADSHEEKVKKAQEKKEAQEEARQNKAEDLSLVNVAQT